MKAVNWNACDPIKAELSYLINIAENGFFDAFVLDYFTKNATITTSDD